MQDGHTCKLRYFGLKTTNDVPPVLVNPIRNLLAYCKYRLRMLYVWYKLCKCKVRNELALLLQFLSDFRIRISHVEHELRTQYDFVRPFDYLRDELNLYWEAMMFYMQQKLNELRSFCDEFAYMYYYRNQAVPYATTCPRLCQHCHEQVRCAYNTW